MLRALVHPASFLGLLVGFLLAVAAHGGAQRVLARALRVRMMPTERGVAGYLDPFGAVAAVLGGPGWGRNVAPAWRSPARRAIVLLAGPVAAAGVAAAAFAGYRAVAGTDVLLTVLTPGDVYGGIGGLPIAQVILLCIGLEAAAVAILSLIPLPPLTGWWLLVIFVRPTLGWQRVRLQLEENNIGVVILLILVAVPLGGARPLFVQLIDAIVGAILQAVATS